MSDTRAARLAQYRALAGQRDDPHADAATAAAFEALPLLTRIRLSMPREAPYEVHAELQRGRVARRLLIDAQVAIFANQARDEEAGIRHETDEYSRLHREYYALEDETPRWARLGVWRAALREHNRMGGR